MIEILLAVNLIYALLLYRNGRKNAAGFAIVFTLLGAAFYYVEFFIEEFSLYMRAQYGTDTARYLSILVQVLTQTDSLSKSIYSLMVFSLLLNFLFAWEIGFLVVIKEAKPICLCEYRVFASSVYAESAKQYRVQPFRTATLAHLRI